MRCLGLLALLTTTLLPAQTAAPTAPPDPFVVYTGSEGVLQEKHIVFVTGDEEYRSEESLPQLARILAMRHGARCTVLFAIDKQTGAIDPGVNDNIPGLEALDHADLLVLLTRFRDLPDAQMQHVVDYVESGRPIVGLRTATHAFSTRKESKFHRFAWNDKEWEGGFGRQVLGETWVEHFGEHGVQGTRGVLAEGAAQHPILRGFTATGVWDPADVYTVRLPLPAGCVELLRGEVLASMAVDAKAAKPEVTPTMPIAWTREWQAPNGKGTRVFTTTIGSAQAFAEAGTRRLLVNACLWALGMEAKIKADLDVALVGDYAPSPFGFGKHKQGVRPVDLAWPAKVPAAAK